MVPLEFLIGCHDIFRASTISFLIITKVIQCFSTTRGVHHDYEASIIASCRPNEDLKVGKNRVLNMIVFNLGGDIAATTNLR